MVHVAFWLLGEMLMCSVDDCYAIDSCADDIFLLMIVSCG
jgi:hypothetical protein